MESKSLDAPKGILLGLFVGAVMWAIILIIIL